jgi:hypothetical protein
MIAAETFTGQLIENFWDYVRLIETFKINRIVRHCKLQ